jgi:hypothetical protein
LVGISGGWGGVLGVDCFDHRHMREVEFVKKVSDFIYFPSLELATQTADFQHVVSIDFGGGYDWDQLEAWYSPSRRRFFWLSGSGCSCDSLGDGVYRLADMSEGNRESLVAAVRAKYNDSYRAAQGSLDYALNDIATVRKFKATSDQTVDPQSSDSEATP